MRILLFLFTLEQRGSIIPWALLDFDRLTVTEPEYIEKTLRNSLSYETVLHKFTGIVSTYSQHRVQWGYANTGKTSLSAPVLQIVPL